MEVKIINHSGHNLPAYQTAQSAGVDLRACLKESVILHPMERRLIPTGLFIELPDGYEAQVRPRSGLALKHGITVLNSPGTIDADYRGEISVLLINLSKRISKLPMENALPRWSLLPILPQPLSLLRNSLKQKEAQEGMEAQESSKKFPL